MKGRNQSRQRGKKLMGRKQLSLTVAKADGVRQGIPDSKGNITFKGKMLILKLF